MHLLQAIMMGIVQGLSEFLPISSSGHLVFTSNFYKNLRGIPIVANSGEEVFLDIMLHLGTLTAVLIFFRKDILNIIKAIYCGFKNKDYENSDFKVGVYIAVSTLLTTITAVPLCGISEKLVFMPAMVAILLILTGALLLFSEYYSKNHTQESQVTLKESIYMGIAQGLASLPGFSRSGFTIASGMLSGADRASSARYSFLMSIPVIIGASMIYPLIELDYAQMSDYNWVAIIVGTIVSGIVGYFCIKYFLKFISKFSLRIFGYYCIIMGAVAFILFWGV